MTSISIYGISDIHTENYKTLEDLPLSLPKANILILAGDIGNPRFFPEIYEKFLETVRPNYEKIILVAGNHEYYNVSDEKKTTLQNFTETHRALKNICDKHNVIFLNRDTVIINGVMFIGCTLWSNINMKAFELMNESDTVFTRKLHYNMAFTEDYNFLEKVLRNNPECPKIVITHHLPSNQLNHPRFIEHPCNSGFYTDILETLCMTNVSHWFCGHTHENSTKKIGNCQFIVNPVGYRHEKKTTSLDFGVITVKSENDRELQE